MRTELGNRVFTFLSKMVDAVALSALWVIFCLPVFTIGASSTAFYYATHKALVRSRGYIWRTFWEGFKSNFKQATLSWLIQLAVLVVFALDILIMRGLASQGSTAYTVLLYIFYVLMAIAIVWCYYTIAYQARFENTVRNSLKNAGVIAFLNLPWSLLIFAIFVLTVLVILVIPIFIFLMPTVQFLLYDTILERIFRKYMKPEDLERELENDRLDKEQDIL
ncbi:MAG: YesL family protein [Agathobacter sp.]|nr:YesL family protein [Agathobacter sp.]